MLGLTLDHATLFYYSMLSGASPERDHGKAIEKWKLAVPKGRRPSLQASNSVIGILGLPHPQLQAAPVVHLLPLSSPTKSR
jgi:hypothetical protein